MEDVEERLSEKGLGIRFTREPWMRAFFHSLKSGYLDTADLVKEHDTSGTVFGLDKQLESEQIQMRGFGIALPLTQQQEYKVAQVVSYKPALELLAELYDKVALSVSSLTSDKSGNMLIAVGMLAAAGLCDVSPEAVRLSIAGKEFVELLVGDESLVSI